MVLVALTGRAGRLEGAERRIRARNRLRCRPMVAAVIAVCPPDRGRCVDAVVGFELRPGQIRPPIEPRCGVVVGDDPLLVVKELCRAEVAPDAIADEDRELPDPTA